MHYFIFPSKDSYITTEFQQNNFGSDEILELRKIFSGSFSTSAEAASRILIQFNYSDISSSIVDGDITNPKFYLRLYEVEGQKELDKSYSLSSYPLSQSWEEGIGKYFDNPKTEKGVIWKDYNSGSAWSLIPNTNTIYSPKLEVRWDDHKPVTGSNTGSMNALTMSGELENHIFIKGLQLKYRESEKVRFRIGCRKKYTQKTFTESMLTSSFYIPSGSGLYSIVDVTTDTQKVPFSAYTSMSCDSTSMYFDQWFNTFEPGRYYKVLFKLKYTDGQEIIYDNDEEFKVI